MNRWRMLWAGVGLAVGMLFYVAYRSERTMGNRAVSFLCGASGYADLKHTAARWLPMPPVLRGCLPSALWCAIGVSLLGGWRLRVGRATSVPLAPSCPLINAGWEGVQWLGWTDGRADWLDVGAGGVGWAVACGLFSVRTRPLEEIAAGWNWRTGVVVMGVASMGLADVWR